MTVATVKVTINSQEYTLTYNDDTQYWETTITAPTETSGSNNSGSGPGVGTAAQGKGYYPVTVLVTDDATNTATCNDQTDGALGLACRLKVLEKVKPVATITSPTEGAYIKDSTPVINLQATDSGSGINPTTGSLVIDSGTPIPITLTGSGTTYTASHTPTEALGNGSHTITFTVTDYDGNVSNTASVTFTVDTLPPTLEITSPTEGYVTNQTTINVVGIATDAHSSPVTVTITVNSADQGEVTLDGEGNFTKAVTLQNGANIISVTATDESGQATTVTRNVTVSTTAPVIEEIIITPNPVDGGQTYTIQVKVTDTA